MKLRNTCFSLVLSVIVPSSANAQMGSSDTGLNLINDHFSINFPSRFADEDATLIGTAYTFSFNKTFTYHNVQFSPSYLTTDWYIGGSLNYKVINSHGAYREIGDLGDVTLKASYYLNRFEGYPGSWNHHVLLGMIFPMAPIQRDLPQDVQSTLGIPSLTAGYAIEHNSYSRQTTFAGLGYQHFFSANAIGLEKGDNISVVLRTAHSFEEDYRPKEIWSLGFDLNSVYQLTNDKMHHASIDETKGFTVNLGLDGGWLYFIDFSRYKDAHYFGRLYMDLYAYVPVVDHFHIDGLKRSLAVGLTASLSFRDDSPGVL